MYKLLQNPTLRLCRLDINKVGLEKAIRIIPGVGTHMRCSQYGASKFEADDIKCYVHVADIEATELDEAFGIHNGHLEEKITRYAPRQHSLSIGDILLEENGTLHMCDPEGWTEIGNSRDFIFFPGTHTW